MGSLSKLKKKSNENLEKLAAAAKEATKPGGNKNRDERFWWPPFDQEKGIGYAVVRFLPAPEDEDLPWVQTFRHTFQGPTGKYYMENCLSTIGQDDPVNQMNSRLWNSGVESDKEIARDQKRQLKYISNILVITDKGNPENEGKVFLWAYGQSIYKKIEEQLYPDTDDPEFADKEPLNPFNFWEGADFVLKAKIAAGYRNYGSSYFKEASELFDGDEDKLEEVWGKCHSIQQFLAPDQFKTYDELKNRLYEVLGSTVGSGIEVVEGWGDEEPAQKPKKKAVQKPKKEEKEESVEDSIDNEEAADASSDDDDDMDFFESL